MIFSLFLLPIIFRQESFWASAAVKTVCFIFAKPILAFDSFCALAINFLPLTESKKSLFLYFQKAL